MDRIVVPRSGDRPLEFEGVLLSESSSRGRDANRWHELTLYEMSGDSYVLTIAYRTNWEGETETDTVFVCNSLPDVMEQLRMTSPIQGLLGYPPGEAYAEKRARLERDISLRWDVAISHLMKQFPERI